MKIGDSPLMCNVANIFLSLLYLHEFLKLPQTTIKIQKKILCLFKNLKKNEI